jgi:hypothetical protein
MNSGIPAVAPAMPLEKDIRNRVELIIHMRG